MATAQLVRRRARPSLTPKQIDARASCYEKLTLTAASLDEEIAAEKSALITLCKQIGHMPPKAEKTLRVEGIEYQIDASFGDTARIDNKVVGTIKAYLGAMPSTFRKMFRPEISYSILPTAQEALASLASPGLRTLRTKVEDLFRDVQKVTPRTPSLKIAKRTVSVKKGGRS